MAAAVQIIRGPLSGSIAVYGRQWGIKSIQIPQYMLGVDAGRSNRSVCVVGHTEKMW